MRKEYRYQLDPSPKKFICPRCHKQRLVRYLDTLTGKYIPSMYGRCDRESKCAYELNPYTDKYAQGINETEKELYGRILHHIEASPKKALLQSEYSIPQSVLNGTLKAYELNVFLNKLITHVAYPFEVYDIEKIIQLYYLGTIKEGYRRGALTLPFINVKGEVKAIQVKQFDENNHTIATDYLHTMLEKYFTQNNILQPTWLNQYLSNEKKVTCLFGEHLLLHFPNNPIALVEAPKTAIYGTLYFGFPDTPTHYLWLAVYNLSSLNIDKCKELKNRVVYLFPDSSADGKSYELWLQKAMAIERELGGSTKFIVSDYLEGAANIELKAKGGDLADELILKDWRDFRKDSTPYSGSKETSKLPKAYICSDKQLYIKMPFNENYTCYPNIESYNQRLCLPTEINQVHFETLKVSKVPLINSKIVL